MVSGHWQTGSVDVSARVVNEGIPIDVSGLWTVCARPEAPRVSDRAQFGKVGFAHPQKEAVWGWFFWSGTTGTTFWAVMILDFFFFLCCAGKGLHFENGSPGNWDVDETAVPLSYVHGWNGKGRIFEIAGGSRKRKARRCESLNI